MRTTLPIALALAVAAFSPRSSRAANDIGDFFTNQTGDWNATTTWTVWDGSAWSSATTVPGAGDTATISRFHTVTVDSVEEVRTLIMQDGTYANQAKLIINSDKSLKINHALEMEDIAWGARPTITLGSTGGSAGELLAGADIVVDGTVVTGADGGKINDDGGTYTVTVTGTVTATGGPLELAAPTVLHGTASASANQTLTFSGTINDGSTGTWSLNAPGSKINFTSAVTVVSAAARLRIINGTLDIDGTFIFAGGATFGDATIEVAAGETFQVNGRYR